MPFSESFRCRPIRRSWDIFLMQTQSCLNQTRHPRSNESMSDICFNTTNGTTKRLRFSIMSIDRMQSIHFSFILPVNPATTHFDITNFMWRHIRLSKRLLHCLNIRSMHLNMRGAKSFLHPLWLNLKIHIIRRLHQTNRFNNSINFIMGFLNIIRPLQYNCSCSFANKPAIHIMVETHGRFASVHGGKFLLKNDMLKSTRQIYCTNYNGFHFFHF